MKATDWVWIIAVLGLGIMAWLTLQTDGALRVPEQFEAIQAALAVAQPGDLIVVNAAKGPFDGPIEIHTANVRLISSGGSASLESEDVTPVVKILADGVTVKGFSIRGNGTGIVVEAAQNAVLEDNRIQGNKGIGVFVYGGQGHSISGNQIINNLHGVWLSDQTQRNAVRHNTIMQNAGLGVVLGNASQNTVAQNRIEANAFGGVQLLGGNQNRIYENQIAFNQPMGIMISDSSRANTIKNNTLKNNSLGIRLNIASDNLLLNNSILDHQADGILLESATGNTVCANRINNNHTGIRLTNASGNQLIHNTIEQNVIGVLALGISQENQIRDNNFLTNQKAGIINQAGVRLEARNNFWGDAAGPKTSGNQSAGDLIEGVINSDPWQSVRVVATTGVCGL